MSPGSTRTGGVLERMILPALDQGGYSYQTQVHLGQRLGARKHVVDAVADKDGRKVLISLKWQQVSALRSRRCRSRSSACSRPSEPAPRQGLSRARRRRLDAPELLHVGRTEALPGKFGEG